MKFLSLEHMHQCSLRETASDEAVGDPDHDLDFAVGGVKVRRLMISIQHDDDDAEEAADDGYWAADSVLPRARDVVGELHAEQRVHAHAKGLLDAHGHFTGEVGVTVQPGWRSPVAAAQQLAMAGCCRYINLETTYACHVSA